MGRYGKASSVSGEERVTGCCGNSNDTSGSRMQGLSSLASSEHVRWEHLLLKLKKHESPDQILVAPLKKINWKEIDA